MSQKAASKDHYSKGEVVHNLMDRMSQRQKVGKPPLFQLNHGSDKEELLIKRRMLNKIAAVNLLPEE